MKWGLFLFLGADILICAISVTVMSGAAAPETGTEIQLHVRELIFEGKSDCVEGFGPKLDQLFKAVK